MNRGEAVPLSSAQRRFWFLHRLDPAGHAQHLCLGLHLTGPLDVVALSAALHDVVDRHEILRTVYPADAAGEPTVVALTRLGVDLLTVTIRDLSVELRDAAGDATAPIDAFDLIDPADEGALRAAVVAFGQEPIEITDEIPLRAQLVRVGPGDHVLQLVLARIAGDESGWEVLLADLAAGYEARCQARRAELGPPPAQYVDHARRAATAERRLEIAGQLAWWREELTPPPPPLTPALAGAAATPTVGRPSGQHRITLTPRVSRGLRDLAAAHESSLPDVLFAAGIVLLHRCTGQADIAVAACVPGRDRSGFTGVAGNFDNLVVLRVRADAHQTFGALLDAVRERARAARDHGDAPFDEVVRAVRAGLGQGRPSRGAAAGGGLVDVLVHYQTPLPRDITLAGLRAEPLRLGTGGGGGLPLALLAEDDGGTITVSAVVDTGVFTAADAQRFAGRLARLCEQLGADAILGELDPMTAAERHLVVDDWPSGRVEPLVDRCLTDLVADQTRRTPGAAAVVAAGSRVTLTYADLERRADAVAEALRAAGVGPEVTVGVCVPRSAALIVALLGVLRAGGAFVPLEPSWPARRIATVAEGAGITAIVAAQGVTLPIAAVPGLRLDLAGRLVPAAADTVPRNTMIADSAAAGPEVDLENLAYVTFTSGSTGEPKGVMIRHQAICNRLRWQVDLLRLTGDDVVLHRAPLGLDISINEIFLPLVAGARLVVAPPGVEGDPGALLEIIREHSVTFCYVATSMLEAMLDHPAAPTAGRSLRYVWCGGETMGDELYRRFREQWNAWMFHGYGPAEATIGVSHRVFEPATAAAHVTIGRPNPNTQLRVLDAEYNPVPVGTVGELFVSGLPLARGYLGDPRRTADRFVPDPFSPRAGSRMYATGDLARFRTDGEIEFLGPREWLGRWLPRHMVPDVFVAAAGLPSTSSTPAEHVEPAPGLQRQIADAWSEVLGGTRVGARDDFFVLGGHSLLLGQVQTRLGRELGHRVALADLYAHSTVEDLARRLGAHNHSSGNTSGKRSR
ncbi:Amino acid adenylation domain-containing protein [Frankia sp. AiPs1]|uniref:non-ribosomal peptide synthetase n=1 Tax=Frankia sp. AiPa1 TaxID=573492 RepID=UPI00202B7456|nr:amino acid adenylation domain-containing protein [Frankia sp. AiPa1]MCL9761937.1 amino acid adenylation domain-containing protein [Frankia sp. AiPa1]